MNLKSALVRDYVVGQLVVFKPYMDVLDAEKIEALVNYYAG